MIFLDADPRDFYHNLTVEQTNCSNFISNGRKKKNVSVCFILMIWFGQMKQIDLLIYVNCIWSHPCFKEKKIDWEKTC